MKWNASLIFTCGFQELGTLRKVICWKTHIPVRTPKWLPRSIFCRGMSRPVNWYRDHVIKACDTCGIACEHVNSQGELWSSFPCALDLSVKPGFHMSGKSQTIGDFTFCRPSQILPIYRIERFSIECRKTKTRVITLANHKGHR